MPRRGSRLSAQQKRSQSSQHNAHQPLIKLPAEIRNAIWELVMPMNVQIETSKRQRTAEEYAFARGEIRAHQLHSRSGPGSLKSKHSTEPYTHTKLHINRTRADNHDQRVVDRQAVFQGDIRAFLEGSKQRRAVTPGITQVCAAIRSEALCLFYGSNIFELRRYSTDINWETAEKWLSLRPAVALDAIRRIVVTFPSKTIPLIANVDVLQVALDLSIGSATSVAFISPRFSASRWEDSLSRFMGWKDGNISFGRVGASISQPEESGFRLTLPEGILTKKNLKAKRAWGFGNGEVMTWQRLAKIVKVFDSGRSRSNSQEWSLWLRETLSGDADDY